MAREIDRVLAAGGLVWLSLTCATRLASADPSDADLRNARQLFADAEKDEDANRWSNALDKIKQVAQVKLTAGVRYHIALCEEHLGHLAQALDDFTAAEGQATKDGASDVLRLVGKQLVELGPRVPRLTVHVVPPVANATVKIDRAAVSASLVGTAIVLDPGPHAVEVAAPGYATNTTTVTLSERDAISIDVTLSLPPTAPAPLAPVPAPVTPNASAPAPAREDGGGSRTGAIVATGGSLVLLAGGIGAFIAGGNAVSSGQTQCAQEVTFAPCSGQKTTVRAWDFTAAGAWLAAAGVGVLAVYLWTRPGPSAQPSAAFVVGPASISFGGKF